MVQDDVVQGSADKIQVVESIKDFIASPFEIITRDVEDLNWPGAYFLGAPLMIWIFGL